MGIKTLPRGEGEGVALRKLAVTFLLEVGLGLIIEVLLSL